MKTEMVVWEIGDVCGDGHGKYETLNMIVEYDGEGEVLDRLTNAENLIQEKFDINLGQWFENYEENTIPADDVEKLDNIGIEYQKSDLEVDGVLTIFVAEDYFQIWKQLIEKADNGLKIHLAEQKVFYGKCTGYGLYE